MPTTYFFRPLLAFLVLGSFMTGSDGVDDLGEDEMDEEMNAELQSFLSDLDAEEGE